MVLVTAITTLVVPPLLLFRLKVPVDDIEKVPVTLSVAFAVPLDTLHTFTVPAELNSRFPATV